MKKIILIFTPLEFYTQHDETLFFEWIKKIECIESFKGIGEELHVSIKSKKISNNDLFDLMGLFERYKLKNSDQLKIFINDDNKEYF